MPVNFCKAGANCALQMLEFFGKRIQVVADVHEELARKAEGSAAIRRLVDEWPEDQILPLDLPTAANAASILKVVHAAGDHPNADLGEIATVLYAQNARDLGIDFVVCTDDNFGKQLARDRRLELTNSPRVIVELVCGGALQFEDGRRVWQQCFTNRAKWSAYHAQILAACPQQIPG